MVDEERPDPKRKTFFVGVTSCGSWCGYGAYAVAAENSDQAIAMVKEEDFSDWDETRLTFSATEINPVTGVQELDEIELVG
jgi:hypothetical protein